MKTIITRGLLTFAIAACLEVPAYSQTLDREYDLEIERQPLAAALTEFSKQTGLQIGYFPETLTESIYIGPISGRYTAEAAISQLLLASGLSFERLNERTIAVTGAESAKPKHRRFSTMERRTDGHREPSFVRLANVRLAEGASEEEDGQQTRTAANPRRSDDNNRRRRSIEEVVVTAQKRTERLQDVPISISVITADDIDRRGLLNAEDYLRGMPGVNQMDSGYGQSIVIRGIETSTSQANAQTGPNVATYFGETPTTTSAGIGGGSNIDIKLVDIERVEVLRGPQGTAFGNSSMGGTVRTIPVAPKLDDFEGRLYAGYSATSGNGGDNYNIQGVGNVPLIIDRLAIRATGYQYQESGYYRNRAGSDAAFLPSLVSPVTGEPYSGLEPFTKDDEEVGSYYVLGGRIAALFQASENLRLTLSYLSQKTELDGIPLATSGTYEQTVLQVAPEHSVRGKRSSVFDTDIDIANVVMEYNFGWADLFATYSHTKSGSVRPLAFTSVGNPTPASSQADSNHRAQVGEVRLATTLDGPWNFLAGLYAERIKGDYLNTYFWHGNPEEDIYAPGERLLGVNFQKQTLTQKAAFAEASWKFLTGFTLTGGVRAYEYDRAGGIDADGVFYGVGGIHVSVHNKKLSGENFRANLTYQPNDGALLYASWSQGFRLGSGEDEGGAGGLPSGLCDQNNDGTVDGTGISIASTRKVDSDEVDNYELGAKLALLDRRLTIDATIFRMEWSGMPVYFVPVPFTSGSPCGGYGYIANAGAAVSEGVELQATFQITEPLSVNLGGSWIDARLTEDVPAQGWSSGDKLPGTPEVNASLGIEYAFEISGRQASLRADSSYVGEFDDAFSPSAATKTDSYLKLDVSGRLEIGRINIDLFVRNLTNEDAFTFRGANYVGGFYGYRMRPRTIGFQLGYDF